MKEFIRKNCGNNNMKNRILIILGIIILGFILSMIIPVKTKTWTYNLPNHYVCGKVNNDSVIIGKYINKKLVTKDSDKNIGVSEYVEAFATSGKYILARCINNKNNIVVDYYIIDSSIEKVYGSYELEGFLDKLKELNISDDINWITSSSMEGKWEDL